MPQGILSVRFSGDILVPEYQPNRPLVLPVNLSPSASYAKGQILLQSGSATNAVQTLTITGTPTGGSTLVAYTNPLTGATGTFTIAYNSTTAQAQTAVGTAFAPGTVTVTGTTLPGGSLIFTFTGALAASPVPLMTSTDSLTGGSTPASAIANTTPGVRANTFIKYAGTSGNPSAILPFACQTDAAGNITTSSVASTAGGMWGETYMTVEAYFSGYFDTSKLTLYDANALAKMGKEISNLASGGKLFVVTGA